MLYCPLSATFPVGTVAEAFEMGCEEGTCNVDLRVGHDRVQIVSFPTPERNSGALGRDGEGFFGACQGPSRSAEKGPRSPLIAFSIASSCLVSL